MRRRPCRARGAISAVPDRTLEAQLRVPTADLLERLPGAAVGRGVDALPLLSDPERQLRGVKMIGAAVHGARGRAVLELHVDHVRVLGGALRVSAPGHRADATEQATADESQDVELVRPLPERHAAAQAGVELLGVARAVEPIREAPVVQHADPAESTALSDFPDLADRRLEAVRVAHPALPAVRLGRPDHPVSIAETESHLLFYVDVLAMLACEENILGVVLPLGPAGDGLVAR